jgi:type IV pilus assembly protein PilC
MDRGRRFVLTVTLLAGLFMTAAGMAALLAPGWFADAAGFPSKGEVAGATKAAVIEELRSRGLTVMDLKQKKTGFQMEITLVKRVKASELTVMSRQLATMISSGMTLLRAFYVLEEQVENPKLRETLSAVREDIEAGLNFSDALARHPPGAAVNH